MNPAFSRFHRHKNILYTCTESVAENGQVISWGVSKSGKMQMLGSADAQGTSTCYITLDKQCRRMLIVNYWDATIRVFDLNQKTGEVMDQVAVYDPNQGREMKARADKHVNHSENDDNAQKDRQADPHSHAVIMDP